MLVSAIKVTSRPPAECLTSTANKRGLTSSAYAQCRSAYQWAWPLHRRFRL